MNCFSVKLPGCEASLDLILRQSEYEFVMHHDRPFMLVIPGGGYRFLGINRAETLALAFTTAGYQAGILHYTVEPDPNGAPLGNKPLLEAAAAVRYIREHAEEWGVNLEKITVMGASAGGHLAGALGVFGANPDYIPGAEDGKCLPNAMILNYALISAGEFSYREAFKVLTGRNDICPENDRWSLELHVTEKTPPAFIWTTLADEIVPAENSLLFAEALKEKNVPFDLHLFESGWHGITLGNRETACQDTLLQQWVDIALIWANDTGVGPGYID